MRRVVRPREVVRFVELSSRRLSEIEHDPSYDVEKGEIIWYEPPERASEHEIDVIRRDLENAGAARAIPVRKRSERSDLPKRSVERIESGTVRSIALSLVERASEDVRSEARVRVERLLSANGL